MRYSLLGMQDAMKVIRRAAMNRLRLYLILSCMAALSCLPVEVLAQDSQEVAGSKSEAILSDTSGEIEEVVLQYSSSLAFEVLPTYKSFLSQIEPDTIVHIVCETAGRAEMFRIILDNWHVRNMERFRITNAGREISVWARDRFVVKSSKDNRRRKIVVLPALPRSESSDRLNDKDVPAIIARSNGEEIESKEMDLFFEGGNIVTSDSYLFTGHSTLADPKLSSSDEVFCLLEKEFGKKVVVVGDSQIPEPQDHIDMYLTPISDKVVLLGDPSLAKGILTPGDGQEQREENVPEQEPGQKYKPESEPEPEPQPGMEPEPEPEPKPESDMESEPDPEPEPESESGEYSDYREGGSSEGKLLKSYEQARKQLERQGFKVERIPIVHDEYGCTITYNNVLMESRNGRRIVYMPVYGVQKLDAMAAKKYESLGFEVRPVDVSKVYRFGGTLRCVTNVLSRKYEAGD